MKETRLKNILTLVFFLSGFSSLIYQVAWHRILTLYYSVESISTTLIVSVYMLGLGIGALIGGHLADRISRRVEAYVFVELAIGIFGYYSIPALEQMGLLTAGSAPLYSFFYMFGFLCIPTFLMGTTLPLLIKIYNIRISNFNESISYLYFCNTLGAAIGALISSYILISFFGLDYAIYMAASLNVFVSFIILFGRKSFLQDPGKQIGLSQHSQSHIRISTVYTMVFITGFVSIAYEIIWFRIIGVIVKASPYSFSTVLAVFLLGIALGSFLMRKNFSKKIGIGGRDLFCFLQFSIAIYVLTSIILYFQLVKNVPIFSTINSISFNQIIHPSFKIPDVSSPGHFFKDVFLLIDIVLWPLIFVFIPTLIMGASFPLINSLAYEEGKEGDTVGKVYMFNIIGNVAGGLITGLLLFDWLGTEYTILLLSFAGIAFLLPIREVELLKSSRAKMVTAVIVAVMIFFFYPRNNQLYKAIHPATLYNQDESQIIGEGIDGINVTYSYHPRMMTFVNGMAHGGRPNPLFCYEAIETLSYGSQNSNVLVIGFGTGTIVETLLQLRPKPNITIVELSETLIQNLSKLDPLRTYLQDENVHLVIADGRKYLYNNRQKFDAVFIDPLRSSTSYSNNLYSTQFFQLVEQNLADGGVFMVWMDEFHVLPKTVCSAFDFVVQYKNFCVASNSVLTQDQQLKGQLTALFPQYRAGLIRLDSLSEKRSRDVILQENSAYAINKDYKPWCEYFIGLKFINFLRERFF